MRVHSKSVLLLPALASSAAAFMQPGSMTLSTIGTFTRGREVRVSQMDPPPTTTSTRDGIITNKNSNGISNLNKSDELPTSWECDDDASCVEVAACDEQECRTSLDVRIHGQWYDLAGWRKAHPSGAHWIDWYDGRDATEVMDAFHSEKAQGMYKRLPKSKEETATMLDAVAPPDTELQLAFRKFRAELEQEGWWKRDITHEIKLIGLWASLVLGAAATAHSIPAISIVALSLSFTAAGWLGHDYCHGVDPFSMRLRNFAAFCAGLLPTWWVDKHNKHHALSKYFPFCQHFPSLTNVFHHTLPCCLYDHSQRKGSGRRYCHRSLHLPVGAQSRERFTHSQNPTLDLFHSLFGPFCALAIRFHQVCHYQRQKESNSCGR